MTHKELKVKKFHILKSHVLFKSFVESCIVLNSYRYVFQFSRFKMWIFSTVDIFILFSSHKPFWIRIHHNCRYFHFFLITQTILDPDPPNARIRIQCILIRNIASVWKSEHLLSVICHQEEGGNDELDELTPDELKSLLDNFPTLSKQEKRLAFENLTSELKTF